MNRLWKGALIVGTFGIVWVGIQIIGMLDAIQRSLRDDNEDDFDR